MSETPMGKLTPTFLLFGGALLLWTLSVGISSYFAKQDHVEGSHRGGKSGIEISGDLAKLRSAADAAPKELGPRLAYATALRQQAYESSSSEYLMEAVQQYSRVLEISPENAEALYGLASLCLEAGIVDKALEYYPRYITLKPDDMRGHTDYALALLQANRLADSRAELAIVLKADPAFVPARMTMALSYKLEGDLKKAKQLAEETKTFIKDDEAKQRIDEFIKALDAPPPPTAAQAPDGGVQPPSELVSPAEQVANYFRSHTIVGPKVRGITWPELTVAEIKLENFPVEQMPPFAKEKFISGTKAALAALPKPVKVRLVDAGTSRELLVIDVGGAK